MCRWAKYMDFCPWHQLQHDNVIYETNENIVHNNVQMGEVYAHWPKSQLMSSKQAS